MKVIFVGEEAVDEVKILMAFKLFDI